MDKLDNGGQFMVMGTAVAVSVSNQQNQDRTDAFAAGTDDVFGYLVYQRDV